MLSAMLTHDPLEATILPPAVAVPFTKSILALSPKHHTEFLYCAWHILMLNTSKTMIFLNIKTVLIRSEIIL